MATDAEIIAAVNAADGNRAAAARALQVTPKMLRRLIVYIGSAKFPPPWRGGRKPKAKPRAKVKPDRKPKSVPLPPIVDTTCLVQKCLQPTIGESLIRGIHETLDMGMAPTELLQRLPALLNSIVSQRSPGEEWTREKLAAMQDELQQAFCEQQDSY